MRQSEPTQHCVRKNYQENGMGMSLIDGTYRPSYVCSHPSQNPENYKKSKSNLTKF